MRKAEQEPGFELKPSNNRPLMTLEEAAQACGVSRQGFHSWQVRPVRVEGKNKFFDLASIVRNRVQAQQSARTPDDAECDRLSARLRLLRERIERERIQADQARERYCTRLEAEAVLAAFRDCAERILRQLPDRIHSEFPETAKANDLINTEVTKAANGLQSIELGASPRGSTTPPDTGT